MQRIRLLLALGNLRVIGLACLLTLGGSALAQRPALLPALGALLGTGLLCFGVELIREVAARTIDGINDASPPPSAKRIRPADELKWGLGVQAAALVLILLTGTQTGLFLSLLGASLGNAYWLPPFRLRQSGALGNLTAGACAALAVAAGAAAQGSVTQVAIWTALVLGATAAALSLVRDFLDVDGDAADGVRSLPVVLGARRAALMGMAGTAGTFLLGFVLLTGHIGLRPLPLAAWLGLAGACMALLDQVRRDPGPATASRAARTATVLYAGVIILYVTAQLVY